MKRALVLPLCLEALSEAFSVRPRDNTTLPTNLTGSSNSSEQVSPIPSIDPAPYATSPFPFFIPYSQTQSCDIYGPICQTGSITIAVSLGVDRSISTTLPCSSYLTAQSVYLSAFNNPEQPGANFPYWPTAWQTNFGRSPQCKSYAQAFDSESQLTLSGCGVNNQTVQAFQGGELPPQIPPGVLRHHEILRYECCGNCSLNVPQVRLYYFPDSNAASYCSNKTGVSVPANHTTKGFNKRADSFPGSEVTAMLGGQTFTSPSVYLQLVGEVSLTDQCGTKGFGGPTLTDPFVAIPSGQLSTYEYPYFTKGEQWEDPNGAIGAMFVGDAKPLNVADLACPTFGLGIGSRSGRSYTTVGPPYLPLIIPPPQVLSLDPQWSKACNGFLSYAPGMLSFAIYDPPRTLVPASALAPDPAGTPENTPAVLTASAEPPSTTPVQPAPMPSAALPDQTGSPKSVPDPEVHPLGDPETPGHNPVDPNDQSTAQMSALHQTLGTASDPSPQPEPVIQPNDVTPYTQSKDPAKAASSLLDPIGTSVPDTQSSHAPSITSSGVLYPPMVAPTDQDPPSPGLSNDVEPTGAPYGGYLSPNPQLGQGGAPQEIAQGLGALIFSALGGGAPNKNPPLPVFTVADRTFTANPSGFSAAGSQVLPGHAPVVIAGTPISLDHSGLLIIGSSTVRLLAPTLVSNIDTPSVFTFAEQTFTANSIGLQVAGSQVLPNYAPVTISGTLISLDSSGALILGSLSTHLPASTLAPTPAPNIGIAGDQTLTWNPTGFEIAGMSILPGGPAITISGTPVSLATSGVLVVGSSTTQLPNTISAWDVATIGGQTFTANPTGFEIAGMTILPGGPAVTISGTPVSLASFGIVLFGNSSFIIPSFSSHSPVLTLGGLVFTSVSPSAVVVDGTTLSAGDQAITVDGSRVSLGIGGSVVVGSITTHISPETPSGAVGVLTFRGHAVRRLRVPHLFYCWELFTLQALFAGLWIL